MKNNQNYGIIISSFKCEDCNFHTEKTDDIDLSLFSRKEECNNYSAKMIRKIKEEKIIIQIKIECNKCNKTKNENFNDKENKLEFHCCGQKPFLVTYYLSKENDDSIINNNILKNNNYIDDNIFNNSYNNKNMNNIINQNKNNQLISEDNSSIDEKKNIFNENDIYIKNIDICPWSNISNENKIILIFKYYKRTGVNYLLHCSKKNYFADVTKELIKQSEIDNRILFAVCDSKKLDGEKTIEELKLKNKSLIIFK